MSAKKKPVRTPLHLLQQLAGSLLEHFEQACAQALTDAEKVLAKLEKQRVKVQEKLHKQRGRIEAAAAAGKPKAQAKARANVQALEGSLGELEGRQAETRQYIGELKNDIQVSLALVQGVGKVREAVGKALDQRAGSGTTKPAAAPKAAGTLGVTGSNVTATVAKKAATVRAVANAAVAEPVLSATRGRSRKPAPGKVAPLAEGVAQATVEPAAATAIRRAPRKPRAVASPVPVNSAAPGDTLPNGATTPESGT